MLLERLDGLGRIGGAGRLGGAGRFDGAGRFGGDTAPARVVLDVGTGEGQVARAIAAGFGWPVLGCDTSWGQLTEARRRGGGPRYVGGSAGALPMRDSSLDAAVACLLLEHVADLEVVLGELARVLRPGGCLLVVLNHPIVSTPGSGWIDDHMVDPPEQYWRLGPYLPEATTTEEVARGVDLTFHHRPLSRYLNAASELGLYLTHMGEPPPPDGFVALAPELSEQATMPRMMLLELTRM